ncbi:MAG: hypothetical protein SGJ18_08605 [Pseudomonadota bacterium]|nr:hypothetical protein [Pseudomonadota bacterium]
MKNLGIILLIFWCALGCSSTEKDDYDIYHPSTLHPAANTVDGFYLDKAAPVHASPSKTLDFWIGGCNHSTEGSYYSKTSYRCSNR